VFISPRQTGGYGRLGLLRIASQGVVDFGSGVVHTL
jgi:hypothetical protein